MPAKPSWFPRAISILQELKRCDVKLLDRQAVQLLFGVSERSARNIMSSVDGIRVGNAHAVEPSALIDWLAEIRRREAFLHETKRRARVASELDRARRAFGGRKVTLSIEPQPRSLLPLGVTLSKGELRVQFGDPIDLAAKLFHLSQLMAENWTAVEDLARGDQL